ncbi:unnamed protein product [Effrenium voratum]|nr:unnamed protein product [Effrenium voratum]|mmetsp:Transcript_5390/g.12694  ORF Transcript_5390/g.12694 Transcript_5390/m.12694 type:complete len:283 (+) Transcript_5390:57-905(+)
MEVLQEAKDKSLAHFLKKMSQSSYREDYCLRSELKKFSAGAEPSRPRTVAAPEALEALEEEEEAEDEWNFSDPRTPFCGLKTPLLSTYNSFCIDRGSLIATPPPPKRNKRNRSEVPLGALEDAEIHAPPIWQPFDTRGAVSGRGGLSDEEILVRNKVLYVDPHPARQLQAAAAFEHGPWRPGNVKSLTKSSYTTYVHSRSVEKRLGGRSHWQVGEKNWQASKSDAAFEQGIHKWPRPLAAPNHSRRTQRCATAPPRPTVFGEGPRHTLGRPWRALDGVIQEV